MKKTMNTIMAAMLGVAVAVTALMVNPAETYCVTRADETAIVSSMVGGVTYYDPSMGLDQKTTIQPDSVTKTYDDGNSAFGQIVYNVQLVYGVAARQAYVTATSTGDYVPYYQIIGKILPAAYDPAIKAIPIIYGDYYAPLEQNVGTPCMTEMYLYDAVKYTTGKTGTVSYAYLVQLAKGAGCPTVNAYLTTVKGKLPAGTPITYASQIGKAATTAAATTTAASGTTIKMADGTIFDPAYYAATYPDVAAVVGNSPKALYAHYLKYGKAEGRKPNANTK
jgi:hypothetical protein